MLLVAYSGDLGLLRTDFHFYFFHNFKQSVGAAKGEIFEAENNKICSCGTRGKSSLEGNS